MEKALTIVGIGASAGGLEAITTFFDHLPDKPGIAFVIIQHLSPDFKSMMDELLTRHTAMPVTVIQKEERLEPDHVYLISKEANIVMAGRNLKPVERPKRNKINMPIDTFFHSMAQASLEAGHTIIGVILSGTGSDGSRGIRSIKEAGGSVLVQDLQSARFEGMPLSALNTGLVEQALPPPALAKTVMTLVQPHLTVRDEVEEVDRLFPEEFDLILEEIKKLKGVDFLEYRRTTLWRRIHKRILLTQSRDMGEYLALLKKDPSETDQLFYEFLIGVTQFFRDPGAYESIQRLVIPSLFDPKASAPIRIWVAGCSTGEEAFSLAMIIEEYLEELPLSRNYKIFASDLNNRAIEQAQRGLFPPSSVEHLPAHLRNRYFQYKNKDLLVSQRLQDRIVFATHDILKDPPFINMDLVICRYLLIYLKPDIQQRLLATFQFALRENGFLWLGPSETLGDLDPGFEPLDKRWNIFRNKLAAKPHTLRYHRHHSMNKRRFFSTSSGINASQTDRISSLEDRFSSWLLNRHVPLSLFVGEDLSIYYLHGQVEELFHFPQGPDSFNLQRMAPETELMLFRIGVQKTLESGQVNEYQDIPFQKKDRRLSLHLRFVPATIPGIEDRLVMIEIRMVGESLPAEEKTTAPGGTVDEKTLKEEQLALLEKELKRVQLERRQLIDQLEQANEALQSANEELLAANEEMQSTNEELQSVNEELYSVNAELQSKVDELSTTNSDLDHLLEATRIGAIFVDENLCIRKFTPAINQQFHLMPSDLGRPITTFVNTFRDTDLYGDLRKVLRTGVQIEREVVDHLGHTYLMRLLPYHAGKREPQGVVTTFTDVQELYYLRQDIQRKASMFEVLFDLGHEHILVLDPNGIIQDVNYTTIDYKKEELIGKNIRDVIPFDQQPSFDQHWDMVRNEHNHRAYELKIKSPEGNVNWYANLVYPVVVAGKVKGYILLVRDISELRIAERERETLRARLQEKLDQTNQEMARKNRELEEINTYLDSFVYGAAHDLRAPLTQMRGYLDLLADIEDENDQENARQEMLTSVDRMRRTLDGLIELVDFKKHDLSVIRELSVWELFQDILQDLEPEIKKAGGEIRVNIPRDLKFFYIKPYLSSVLFNLLHNAVKYRSKTRRLKITISAEQLPDEKILITVRDNGIGMDLNRYGHFLFQPFKRLTVEGSGTGIGLSIINNAVKRNGGYIEVESQLDRGATFKVFLKPYETKNMPA